MILVDDAGGDQPGVHRWNSLVESAASEYTIAPTDAEDMALLHFTSGTTGRPKGAVHVHGAVVAHMATGRFALDLHEDDVFWCTADPGWVTGTSYGIIAPADAAASPMWWSRPSSMRRPGTPCSNASASPSGTRRRPPFA